MAKYNRYIHIFLTVALLASCDSYTDVGEAALLKEEQLIGAWKLDFASLAGIDVTEQLNDYDNDRSLILEFQTDNTWTSQNGNIVFEPSGTWSYNPDLPDLLVMDDTEIFFALNFDGIALSLKFNPGGTAVGARVSGLNDEYSMSFSKIRDNN